MGLDTYCCLICYGLTLIHLTGPLSQVVQLKCVMCNIYIFVYIYIEMCLHFLVSILSSLWRALQANTLTHSTLDWILGDKGRAHWSLVLGPSRTRKADYWISKGAEMTSQSTNQGNGLNFAIKWMLNCQHVILWNLNSLHARYIYGLYP